MLPLTTQPFKPPHGWLPLQKTLFGIQYRLARPTTCPARIVGRLAGVAGWMRGNTRWEKIDVDGLDIWGNDRAVQIKSIFSGPREIMVGECEDLALVCWKRCRKVGVPLGALRVAVCILPNGTGHAVLVVETDTTSLIWDCTKGQSLPFESPVFDDYDWLHASQAGTPLWFGIVP